MTSAKPQAALSQEEMDIRALIDRWSSSVRRQDYAGIRADHHPDILMFDVPPPLFSRGLDAYMATWDLFFSCSDKPVVFDFHDLQITAGSDTAFATGIGHCVSTDPHGKHEALQFRLTMGFRKIDGRWLIIHEHHSVPAE